MLEIGTGTGSLTGLLADRAAEVISVEVDSRMHQLASEELFGRQNVTLLLKDALRNKNHLDTGLLALLAERAGGPAGRGVEAGRQSSLQRRHADPRQSAGVSHAAGNDDRDDPKGIGRTDHGSAGNERTTAR